MGWIAAGVLAAVCFAALTFLLKVPRASWAAVGTALLLGLAGYATQARPTLAGSPTEGGEKLIGNEAALVIIDVDVEHETIALAHADGTISAHFALDGDYVCAVAA